jgi:uncharacterized membrane protein
MLLHRWLASVMGVMMILGFTATAVAKDQPNTPKPMTGWLRIVPVSILQPTDWNFAHMLRYHTSFGSARPDSLERTGPAHVITPDA